MKIPDEALDILGQDETLAEILEQSYKRPKYESKGLFRDLVSAIIAQQVSTSAARTIHGRLADRFEDQIITPDGILELSEEELRACGLSRQKMSYVKNIAEHFLSSGHDDDVYEKMENHEIIRDLTQIKGVGEWTVQMVLMMTFEREDVFPSGDLGIQTVMKDLYNLEGKGKVLKHAMEEIAEHWRPYRTYACLYMWNTLH
ncbi:MAG: hypothetical protein R3275_07500 [Saprospiraceae bacterium]|nr:hypothetical protein [Saprospiraceae bacterium]